MTSEPNNNVPTLDDDIDTTAPQSRPSVWKMPDPVFRKTSGRLPQGFERENFAQSDTEEGGEATEPSDPNPTPYIEPKPKSQVLKILLVVLGLAAMIGFIAVFLTVIYFMFLRPTNPNIF